MTARTMLGSWVGVLVAASGAVGCGGRVDDRASGGTGEPPFVKVLGAGGSGDANSIGTRVGIDRGVPAGSRDAGAGSASAVVDADSDAAIHADARKDVARISDAGNDDPVEVWVGQVEHKITSLGDNRPDAPPEHVVLAFFDADGVVGGSIVFGNAAPPPKATDPNAFYPPITPASTPEEQESQYTDMMFRPFDGQPYSLINLHRSDTRLTFEVMPFELWKDWCALQPKTYVISKDFGDKYGCVASQPAGSTPEVGNGALCLGSVSEEVPCDCDEKSCHADLTYGWVVDLERRGDSLEGLTWLTKSATGIWSNGMKLRRVK